MSCLCERIGILSLVCPSGLVQTLAGSRCSMELAKGETYQLLRGYYIGNGWEPVGCLWLNRIASQVVASVMQNLSIIPRVITVILRGSCHIPLKWYNWKVRLRHKQAAGEILG